MKTWLHWLEAWAAIAGLAFIIGAVWLWLERRYPAHTHDEGAHDPHCAGCFAEQVRR